jgi:hypothetical protein
MWLRSSFLSSPTTFLTCKRTISSCLLATIEVVDRPKSYQVDVLCVHYPSELTLTSGYGVFFLLSPTTFHTCMRTISSCLLATVEVVDRRKSYQVDVLCVDYPSELIVTSGYRVLFSHLPLLSLLVREIYHLVSLPQ